MMGLEQKIDEHNEMARVTSNASFPLGLTKAQEIEEAMKKGVEVSAEDVERTRNRCFLDEKHPRID